jgi:peroxiredoxin
MNLQKSKPVATLLILAASALATPQAASPRPSPDLVITAPSGQTTSLSSFRGKVVVLEFFFLRSPHCLELAQTLNKLNTELGPRGLQPVAVAFPAPGSDANGPMVTSMVDYYKLTYPVGFTSKQSVDTYFGRSGNQLLRIPQIVVIDRAGFIRAQSGLKYDPVLENHDSLRNLLENLLNENPAAGGPKRSAPASRSQR